MTFSVPLNESAVEEFTYALSDCSRVLVLGGTGWFGRTALAMLRYLNVDVYIVASYQREFDVDGRSLLARAWEPREIARFEPEVVLDFAYLTVDKALSLGLDTYMKVNDEIAQQLFFAARLPSISRVLSVSSGASVRLPLAMRGQPPAEAYARGKRAIEKELERIALERGISVGIARAWSVTGGHVQNPAAFAFSGMILDGLRKGRVAVNADYRVFRRYLAVEDLLALAVPKNRSPGFSVFDSGGQLIEIRELARLVSLQVPFVQWEPGLEPSQTSEDDRYYVEEDRRLPQLESSRMQSLDLRKQIENVYLSLAFREFKPIESRITKFGRFLDSS